MRSSAPLKAAVLLAIGAAACAPPAAAPAGAPVADADSLVREVLAATTPAGPRQATFTWRMDEAGSVVQGRGAIRFIAPDRMRVDLFGPRGETYLTAALVDGEFRLPPTAARGVQLPSPVLLWGALGVLAPPAGADLASATATDSTARLVYGAPNGETFAFDLDLDGSTRLRAVERSGRSGVLETVRVEHSAEHQPSRTTYLDRSAYRELVLETESIRDVASFPESIWRPDGTPGGP